MAEEQEKLKITAELDTSKLKQQAQQGMQSVVKEEKKVENQSKQTSKAIDDIGKAGKKAASDLKTTEDAGKKVGDSLQQAGRSGTQALKEIGKEADKTAKKISSIDESVKGIKLGQAFGIANRLLHTQAAQHIGGEIGDALGMSDTSKDVAGGMITGALGGASMGAMLGSVIPLVGTAIGAGIGAAAGALTGAASALMDAAKETKGAARNLARETGRESEATINRYNDTKYREETERRVQGYLDNPTAMPKLEAEIERLKSDIVEGKQKRDEIAGDITTVSGWSANGSSGSDRIRLDNERSEKLSELNSAYAKNEQEMAQATDRLNALTTVLETLKKAISEGVGPVMPPNIEAQRNEMVGPVIPDWLRAQREAEANAFVGPEMPPYVKAQREAEEKLLQNKAKNNLTDMQRMAAQMSGTKLTDSLTRIGGGSGYGAQMSGIGSAVKDINKGITELNRNLLNVIGIISNMDTAGVFTE